MDEQFLTVEQVSKILQLHPFTILKYIKQGKLKGIKLGRRYRIKKSDVDIFLENQGVGRAPKETPKIEEKKEGLFRIKEKKDQGTGAEDHYVIE